MNKVNEYIIFKKIVGHPNVRVFLTQGGYQSIEEAIHNAVPMVGMPFFSDQPANIEKLVNSNLALKVDYNTVTKNELKNAILEVVQNKK